MNQDLGDDDYLVDSLYYSDEEEPTADEWAAWKRYLHERAIFITKNDVSSINTSNQELSKSSDE